MNRICVICARGGSKGVPNKNLRMLQGKPLLAYSILQAKETNLFSSIAVSSDSQKILAAAKEWGADALIERPGDLALDTSPKMPAIAHCVKTAEQMTGKAFEIIVDLDATAPLRSVDDILQAVGLLERRKVSNVITGTPARRSPYFNLVEEDEKGVVHLSKKSAVPVVRRQDVPKCYDMNASIYVWMRQALFEKNTLFNSDTLIYEMPPERSLDIDSELDFQMVEFLMQSKRHGRAPYKTAGRGSSAW